MTGRSEGPVLLVLDYPGRRHESRVSDLRLEDAGFDVRYVLAPPFVREVTAPEYAAELLARYGPLGPGPAAVLAYCMAAPIAQELAALCGTDREPVPLVLFDGEPATPAAVEEQYGVSVRQFRAQLGAGGNAAAPMTFDGAALATRPQECVDRMLRNLVELGSRALREDGCSDSEDGEDITETAGQVADFYLDWLVHLVAAHNTSWPRWNGDVLHVVSREHHFAGSWPGARDTTVRRLDSSRDRLLEHPATRDLVLAFLGRVPEKAGRARTERE